MTVTLSTTLHNLGLIPNNVNAEIILNFYKYLNSVGTSDSYQNQNIKQMTNFAKYLGKEKSFHDLTKDEIISYLNTKIKNSTIDPDKKWITTWNDYLWRIKYFLRWFHNYKLVKERGQEPADLSDWLTPSIVSIKRKKTKRISPYLETELWEKEELLCIIKYESSKRNKAILALLWDLDARSHEICLLKNKHLRLREKYGEGEIPHEAKTGTGPVLLTTSFIYVRDWLNEHPFRNEPNSRLICNLNNGSPIVPDTIDKVMKQLRRRIIRLLEGGQIMDNEEKIKLQVLIDTKKWNPYCIRHSAITADSDYLPDYALKKKVRWSMNSRQANRYIKRRMGNDLKQKILSYNGIIGSNDSEVKPSILECARCKLMNSVETRYCSNCSYPLVPSAYDEIKQTEEKRLKKMEEKIDILFQSRKELFEFMKHPDTLAKIASQN